MRALSMRMSAAGLIVGKVGSMGLGFVFWLVAARLFAPAEIGLTAGVVSAMMLCTQLALLGVGSSFIAHYPGHERQPDQLLDTAVTVVGLAAIAFGGAFVLAAGSFGELSVVWSTPAYAVLFVAMSVLGAVGVLLDQVSMAMRRGDHVLVRNVASGLVAVAPLPLIAAVTDGAGSLQLFGVWVAGGSVMCALGLAQLRTAAGGYRYRPRADLSLARGLVGVGLPNHLLTLTERAPGLVLPIVVTELISPAANAHWYAAWMMAWVAYFVPISVGIALFVEVARRPGSLHQEVRQALRTCLGVGGVVAAALWVAGPVVLAMLGEGYAEAATPLRVLVLAVVPLAFVQVYFSVCRAEHRLTEAIVVGAVTGVAGVAASALVGVDHGLTGMAWVWVVVQALSGAWSVARLRSLVNTHPVPAPHLRPVDAVVAVPVP